MLFSPGLTILRNTGHDFIAKSTSRGTLGIWTHILKSVGFLPSTAWTRSNGAAAKVSAVIEAWKALNAMEYAHNFTILGQHCRSPVVGTRRISSVVAESTRHSSLARISRTITPPIPEDQHGQPANSPCFQWQANSWRIPNPRHALLPYAQRGMGVTPTSFLGSPANWVFVSRLCPVVSGTMRHGWMRWPP